MTLSKHSDVQQDEVMYETWRTTCSFPFCLILPTFNFGEENYSEKFVFVERDQVASGNSETKMAVLPLLN